jgi:hypothetical protein
MSPIDSKIICDPRRGSIRLGFRLPAAKPDVLELMSHSITIDGRVIPHDFVK